MTNEIPTTERLATFLDTEHFRYRRFAKDGPSVEETAISSNWRMELDAPRSPLTEQIVRDFQKFCEKCMDVRLASTADQSLGVVRWRTTGAERTPDDQFSRQDRSIESFVLTVSAREILIEAKHERGLLHGTHFLERSMADRGSPWLKRSRVERTPAFSPRISNGVFIEADQQLTAPGRFSDEYLSLMSHFGVNGIHLHTNLWDLSRNRQLPELNGNDVEGNLCALNEFAGRAGTYGIDLYLYLNTRIFDERHPVFLAHPDTRGSKLEFQAAGSFRYNLCSSNERVLACYEEVLEDLFRSAPRLAGAILIVGGEGFFHCYTRPLSPFEGYTSCPNCRKLEPSAQVAKLVNRCAAAIRRTGRHKSVYAWPYSAFTWSGADRAQLRWTARLSDDVSLLSNFDTGSLDRTTRAGVVLYDYNIKSINPNAGFIAQTRKARQLGRPIFAKTETNTTPEAFFVPSLPVHHRWHGRFQAMAKVGVAGFVGQWRFYGMNGSPPEELQYHATWNPDRDTDSLLATIAHRDFGVTGKQVKAVVAGWRLLSEAWDDFPYSAVMCGEREFYMRGPFYLGPAHPLIFNPQDQYGLGAKFRLLRGDLLEMGEPENLEELIRRAKPRYVSDLMLTMPFGVERCRELIARCRKKWERGVLKVASAVVASDRAQMELDVCETVLIHLTTTENVIRFYAARDALWQRPCDCARFKRRIATLEKILRDEIANARRILPILARDPRIGYGHCYGIVYDTEMVQDKLRQCEYVLKNELPHLSTGIRFHLWNDFP